MLAVLIFFAGILCAYGVIHVTNHNSSTMLTFWRAAICCIVFTTFALEVSILDLSVPCTLFCIPIALIVAGAIVRARLALPPSMERNKLPKNFNGKRYQLVAMPVNHFGEKVRWCLDLLDVPYEESTVGGLLSIFVRARSVPWLVDRQSCSVIGNSDEILMYIGAVHVPTNPAIKDKAQAFFQRTPATIEWETKLNDFGTAIQGWCYYYILGKTYSSVPALTAWGAFESKVPWLERQVLELSFPVLKFLMRDAFKLGKAPIAAERLEFIQQVLTKVDESLEASGGPFLFGDEVSYIDVNFCSLAGPLAWTAVVNKGLYSGGRFESFLTKIDMPDELIQLEKDILNRPCGKYLVRMYENHRKSVL